MLVALIVAAVLLGTPQAPLVLTDRAGNPVSGMLVIFTNAAGEQDAERSDAQGRVSARSDFRPIGANVESHPNLFMHVDLARTNGHLTVPWAAADEEIPTIGTVRVATGMPENLHRLPVPAAFLDALDIDQAPQASTDGLLRILPGVDYTRSNFAFTNYGQLRASFDGAGSNRGLVLIDGIPAQDGFGGQIDWAAYPPGSIVRAELLRGAGSSLYGPGAVGGVLDLFTFGPRTTSAAPPDGSIALTVGTRSTSAADVSLRSALGPRATSSLFVHDWRASYYDFPQDFRSSIDTSAQSSNSAEQFRIRFGDYASAFEFGVLFSADHQDQGRPNYAVNRSLQQYSLAFARNGPRSLLKFSTYLRNGFIDNVTDKFPSAPGVLRYTQHVPTSEGGFGATWAVTADRGEFQARLEARNVRGQSDQFYPSSALQNSGSGSQWLMGLALQETFKQPRFEALAGARVDYVSSFGENMIAPGSPAGAYSITHPGARGDAAVSPRIALRYDLSPATALRASAGAGFRPPYLNELIRGFQIGKTVFAPNPGLIPERSHSESAGLDLIGPRSHFDLEFVTTRVSDAIMFMTVAPNVQQRANVARTQTDGASFSYTHEFGRCMRWRASGTTQYARVVAGPPVTIGKRLPYVPDRSADVGIAGTSGRIGFGTDVAFVGQAYADDLNAQPLNSALLVALKLSASLGSGARLELAGANITDRTYLSSENRLGPPSTYSLTLRLPLGSLGSSAPTCGPEQS